MNRFRKIFYFIVFVICVLGLTSCSFSIFNPDEDDIINKDDGIDNDAASKEIYHLAVQSGFTGTYEEWLSSIKGDSVEISIDNGYIVWKYSQESKWNNLVSLASLTGKDGTDGKDGQNGKDGVNGLSAYEIYKKYHPSYNKTEEEWINDLVNGNLKDKEPEVVVSNELSFHFLQLGNYNAGDCTFIKAGDIDILIDAGSRESSVPVIKNYIDQYCTDGILEYVIVTHADQDHIVGFTDQNSSHPGIFSSYKVETIIDFAKTNKTTQVYKNYVAARDAEILAGAKHYTADDCIKEQNGAKKKYQVTEDISFEILEQKYYYTNSTDENNFSVCTLFDHKGKYFLLTGDLEKEGEESLVELNPDLPQVELFKGGHHGSRTSSNEVLLNKIQPKIVSVCCCAGSSEYTGITDNMFPTQDFINRVAKYTDKIYVTTQVEFEVATAEANTKGESKVPGVAVGDEYLKAVSSKYKPLNGDIVIKSYKDNISVNCSFSNKKLKDSDWFNMDITLNGVTRKMRVWPSYGV